METENIDISTAKWQPIMLVTTERVECDMCHALATFLLLSHATDGFVCEPLCQFCFEQKQEEGE